MKLSAKTIYVIIGIAVFAFLFANTGFRKMIRRYWEIHRLKFEIAELKRKNAVLRKEVYFLESDRSYIERIARKELGLISEGEVEYRFKE